MTVVDLDLTLVAGKAVAAADALRDGRSDPVKTISELNERLGALQFTESEDFKAKYKTPFNKAADFALSRVKSLHVTTGEGTVRPATGPVR